DGEPPAATAVRAPEVEIVVLVQHQIAQSGKVARRPKSSRGAHRIHLPEQAVLIDRPLEGKFGRVRGQALLLGFDQAAPEQEESSRQEEIRRLNLQVGDVRELS